MEKPFYVVSEIARRYAVAPRAVSDLFYSRRLDDKRCPIVGGRRLIPADYLPAIEEALRDAGHLQATKESVVPT